MTVPDWLVEAKRVALLKAKHERAEARATAPPVEKGEPPPAGLLVQAGCPICWRSHAHRPMRVIDIDPVTEDDRTLRVRWECVNPQCRHVVITATHMTDYSLVTRGAVA